MDAFAEALESLALLLDYPDEDLASQAEVCAWRVAAVEETAAGQVRAFGTAVGALTLAEQEELYIQTFDMNPTSTLDLGWQLFGEDYNRGLFLVKLRQEMKRVGVPESHELPDHVTHVLRLLGRLEEEKAADFAISCVLPAVEKTFGSVKDGNPYHALIGAVVRLLSVRYLPECKEADHGALV